MRAVDENVEPLDFDTECDVVGISFMTALAPRAYEIAEEFRRRGRRVAGGGYDATLCPEDAAPRFDALMAWGRRGCVGAVGGGRRGISFSWTTISSPSAGTRWICSAE